MSRKCKNILIVIGICIVICFISAILFMIYYFGVFRLYFSLHGETEVTIALNGVYKEAGFRSYYHLKSYDDEVKITSNLEEDKVGEYTITYTIPSLNVEKERKIKVVDKTKPTIRLLGKKNVITFVDNEYVEEGFSAIDNYDGDLSAKVTINSNVDVSKEGKYKITYSLKDASGNTSKAIRNVIVKRDPLNTKIKYNHDEYDNTMIAWWFNKSKDHKRTGAAVSSKELLPYDSFYLGKNEKVIYLTLDEGGSEKTYIKEMTDVMNKYHVKATYFLTRNYIENEAAFMNELVAEGHVIGNHTRNHLDMTSLANDQNIDKFVEEVTSVEKAYMKVTGQEMIKIFRFPKGEGSIRGMKIIQDLGYRNYFWSHAYYDYGAPLSFKEAYDLMINYYHPGAIYLLHPKNEGNYLALETFIKEMLEKGYRFDTVDNIY